MKKQTGKDRRMTENKKRIVCGALLCAMALGMTACGNEIPDLTEEESQRVGEYAAVTLLKYDANNRSRLVDPEIVIAKLEKDAAKEVGRQENAQTEEKPAESNTSEIEAPAAQEDIAASLEDFFGLAAGVTLTYKDYQVADSYPEDGSADDYFALDASTGKKLLILNFELTNGTDQEENVDFLSTASRYIITVNDGTSGNALTTMLPNDMSTYVETMAPGKTQGLVLLLEVNEDMANGIQNISLHLKNASNEYTIQLL